MTCNWRFVNLNDKFRPSTEFAPTRPLHVYCNVGTSSMVGNRVTDLFRKIKYHPQNTTHFEPIHIQYLPVRNELVEIIETQMAEINGDLVHFGEGHTIDVSRALILHPHPIQPIGKEAPGMRLVATL